MAEETQTASKTVQGFHKPFPLNEAANLDGVDNQTGLFEGVHPENKKRLSVTLAGLKAEFGDELGEKKYRQVAGMAGGSVFFNPTFEATSFRPPLGLSGLSPEHAAQVASILAKKV